MAKMSKQQCHIVGPIIIGISGKAFSGKDTVAKMLMEGGLGRRELRAIAGILKRTVEKKFGLEAGMVDTREGKARFLPSEGCTVGRYLQLYGEEMRKLHGDGYWIDGLLKEFDPIKAEREGVGWIISDVRYPNEKKRIEEMGGIVIRVDCSRDVRVARMRAAGVDGRDESHPSEAALDESDFTHHIANESSLDCLHKTVQYSAILLSISSMCQFSVVSFAF